MSEVSTPSYPHPCVGSRIFKKYVNVEDLVYEESIKYLNSTNCNLPFSVRMPYMFHRTQTKCFEALVQHYWFTEIQPRGSDAKEDEYKPVPMLIKIAFSWIVGYDQTFLTDKEFIEFVRRIMLKRIGTWFHSCLTGSLPGCPDSKMSRFSSQVSRVVNTQSQSVSRENCDRSSSAAKSWYILSAECWALFSYSSCCSHPNFAFAFALSETISLCPSW